MGQREKDLVVHTLEATANVLPLLLRDGRSEYVETMVLLLDRTKPLYSGGFASGLGAPEVEDTVRNFRGMFLSFFARFRGLRLLGCAGTTIYVEGLLIVYVETFFLCASLCGQFL